MECILFLSERDKNSLRLYDWIQSKADALKGIKIDALSVHEDKSSVKKYDIRKVPSMVVDGKLYVGRQIVVFFEDRLMNDCEEIDYENVDIEQKMRKDEEERKKLDEMLSNRKPPC